VTPRVAVFIPCYNAEKYIAQCIQSVLAQTYYNWRLVVVDDCSTDNSYNLAVSFADGEKIQVHRNEANLGMLKNWNRGIDLCDSEFFVKLDADDYWHSQLLERAVRMLDQHQSVAIVFTKYQEVDEEGVPVHNEEISLPDFAKNSVFNCRQLVALGSDYMLQYNVMRQGLSVIRRSVFDNIGKYKFLLSEKTQASTDTEFYFRVGCHYDIYQLDEVLYYYRRHNKSISATDFDEGLQAQKMYEVKHAILEYYFNQGIISSDFFKREIKKSRFKFNSFYFSKYRKGGEIVKSMQYLFENFVSMPKETLIHNLHLNRVFPFFDAGTD
jgi:glycosyltransferase involved in cell wall biosynthesis